MHSAELYKLKTHRTPMATAAVLLIAVLSPAAVLLFYTPSSPAAYSEAFTATYQLLGPLLAIVFGGWILGTEYRQGTVKRLLTSEPRRARALASKAVVGLGAWSAVLSATALIGWSAARWVGSMNNVAVGWNGRELLAAGLVSLAAAAIAFALSAVTRSDSFAMVGTTAILLILDPLLSLTPKFGKYSFGTVLNTVTNKVAGLGGATGGPFADASALGVSSASVVLALWVSAFVGSAWYLFVSRDV